jgi:hypothetical protein
LNYCHCASLLAEIVKARQIVAQSIIVEDISSDHYVATDGRGHAQGAPFCGLNNAVVSEPDHHATSVRVAIFKYVPFGMLEKKFSTAAVTDYF